MKKKLSKTASLILTSTVASVIFSSQAFAYTVQPNDSLWKIAMAHHTSVSQIMNLNHLQSSMIYPGQQLQLPSTAMTTQPQPQLYSVVRGDTLWKIAQKYGVTVTALMQANHLGSSAIYPNQKLTIPAKSSMTTPQPVPAPAPAPAPVGLAKPVQFQDGVFPLKKGTYSPFTNTYGDSRVWNPNGTAPRPHEGVDILAPKGTPIYSAYDGTIINQGWNQYGGWRLTVRVDATTAFYYAHMSEYAPGMVKGAAINKGQLIGYVGNTGYGPVGTQGNFVNHLHFGIYKTNTSPWTTIDPYANLKWWEALRN